MPAATILFLDVVKFSKKPTALQKRLMIGLCAEVAHHLRSLLLPPFERPQVVALPTGDGMALGFLHSDVCNWDIQLIFTLIERLQRWALSLSLPETHDSSSKSNIDSESLAIRFGVHTGSVEFITDINGKPNLCGDTINYAQRVMDAANPRQVLFSESAYREYVGSTGSDGLRGFYFDDAHTVTAKHGIQIRVFPMKVKGDLPYWDNHDPISKDAVSVSVTSLATNRAELFMRYKDAVDIAIIVATGKGFLERFKENGRDPRKLFNEKLKRLWVFIPETEIHVRMFDPTEKELEGYQELINEWRYFVDETRKCFPDGEILFGRPKFTGFFGTYLDWNRPRGFIYVYPYMWGVSLLDLKGFMLSQQDGQASAPFEQYRTGLEHLKKSTKVWE